MSFPRGTCVLGAAFGDVAVRFIERLVDDGVDAAVVTAAVDAARVGLAADERVLFMLGYEACCGLDPQVVRAAHDPSLGPATFAWRVRIVAEMPSSSSKGVTATLRTTVASRVAHSARIAACKEALLDGVIYQANLAHRVDVDPVDVDGGYAFFAARRQTAACAAFVDVEGFGSLISLSPERFVTADLAAGRAWTFPIKGTVARPRDHGAVDDAAAIDILRASSKDQAEHVMIVDLCRNDLGRVAVGNGVDVDALMQVVSTASVHHLESIISARLRHDVGVAALMAATAPGGSITGAPKSSAVDVIAALEDGPRGAYTGVLGLVDGGGQLVTSLLIRTWIRPDSGVGALHVGGGIVVDSDAGLEWDETLHKAAAFGVVVVE